MHRQELGGTDLPPALELLSLPPPLAKGHGTDGFRPVVEVDQVCSDRPLEAWLCFLVLHLEKL